MARLTRSVYPGDWEPLPDEQLDDFIKRTDAMLQRLFDRSRKAAAAGKATGMVLQFPVADGRALYVVVKEKPLTLRHVPFGDAWQIPAAHVRGLTMQDVREQARWCRVEAEMTRRNRGED